MNDAELLAKLKAGDKAAFSQLVSLYSARVLNTCYRFLLNKHDAEDISQEVFIEVFNSISKFRGDSSLSTWIYRIITNVFLDERKKAKRHRQTSLDEYIELEENSVTRQIVDEKPTPEVIAEEKEKNRALRDAINWTTSTPSWPSMLSARVKTSTFRSRLR